MSETSTKSRTAAALLAFFLGTIVVHRFYLGRIGTSLTMLLLGFAGWLLMILGSVVGALTLFFGGLGIAILGYVLVAGVGVWVLFDFIMALAGALKDGHGRRVERW